MDYTWEALREQLNGTTAGDKRKRPLQAEDSYLDELDPLDGGRRLFFSA